MDVLTFKNEFSWTISARPISPYNSLVYTLTLKFFKQVFHKPLCNNPVAVSLMRILLLSDSNVKFQMTPPKKH